MIREKFAQFFTRTDIADLILSAVLTSDNEKVLDPGYGEGIFLKRALARLEHINKHTRSQINPADNIWGFDVASPTNNLTREGLSAHLIEADFFLIKPNSILKEYNDLKIPLFDVIVANPPFTRQERINHSMGSEYKEKLIRQIENQLNITSALSKRTSLYAFFMYHSSIFLKQAGLMGYITPNLWLSVDYGAQLQEFLLKNFKIRAIVGSKVERFFESAEVDTIIIILEKCLNDKECTKNLVRFVQLRGALSIILRRFTSANSLKDANDMFWDFVNGINDFTIDDEKKIRVLPISQQQLWEQGLNRDTDKYEGSRWDIYLRAPDIYFKLMDSAKDFWIPLGEIGSFRRGFTTGANRFFYIPASGKKTNNFYSEKDPKTSALKLFDITSDQLKFHIEKEYWMNKKADIWVPNYIIKSPRESNFVQIKPDELKRVVLLVREDKKKLKQGVLRYIEWGESQGFHERQTMQNRQRWYDLGSRNPYKILFPKRMGEKFFVYFNSESAYCDQTLYEVDMKSERAQIIVLCFLNSTIGRLFFELGGYELTGSVTVAELSLWLAEKMLTINPSKVSDATYRKLSELFKKLRNELIDSIYSEVGANEAEKVSLEKVKPLRRELDGIFFEILGLNEQEQLEVYRAVIDLIKSRQIKSKSV
jgi:methylase of polypeptide subunit release factors